jgi:hypothetical protein
MLRFAMLTTEPVLVGQSAPTGGGSPGVRQTGRGRCTMSAARQCPVCGADVDETRVLGRMQPRDRSDYGAKWSTH